MCCATSALAHDLSQAAVFEHPEEFWCYAISPVFFGYYTNQLTTKREKQQGDNWTEGSYKATLTPFPPPTDEEEAADAKAAKDAKEAKRKSTLLSSQQALVRGKKKTDNKGALIVPGPLDEEQVERDSLPRSYSESSR